MLTRRMDVLRWRGSKLVTAERFANRAEVPIHYRRYSIEYSDGVFDLASVSSEANSAAVRSTDNPTTYHSE